MTKTWAKRIKRIEAMLETRAPPRVVFRYGFVKHLPEDTAGGRHVVAVKSEATSLSNVQKCDFEEHFGPSPESGELGFNVYLSLKGAPEEST
jgi:hypothetical protein